jgi:hypothetical protein
MTIQAYLQGREDIVIFRGQLTSAPLVDLELLDPKSWSGRSVLKEFVDRKWESQTYHGLQLLAPAGLLDLARQSLEQLTFPMQKLSNHYVRLSLRRDASRPNLEVHVPFPAYQTLEAKQYFEALRGLAQAVSERN